MNDKFTCCNELSPLEDRKRPPGYLLITWMDTVLDDLRSHSWLKQSAWLRVAAVGTAFLVVVRIDDDDDERVMMMMMMKELSACSKIISMWQLQLTTSQWLIVFHCVQWSILLCAYFCMIVYTPCLKKIAFLFLSELRQISTNFNKFW